MTTTAPSLQRLTPQAAILLLAAAVAWLVPWVEPGRWPA